MEPTSPPSSVIKDEKKNISDKLADKQKHNKKQSELNELQFNVNRKQLQKNFFI